MIVADKIADALKAKGISVKIDNDDKNRPGFKFAEYEMKGIPVRIGLGKRDLENNVAEVARRDTKTKESISLDGLENHIENLLYDIQQNLFNRAKQYREDHITIANSYDELKDVIENKGGFVLAHWDGTTETELQIKEETKATIRCIPLESKEEEGSCIVTGRPSKQRVLFSKAY
jgi:prolyl-tRNA synthetase